MNTQSSHRQRGQTMVEYALVISVVVAALLAVQVYARRAIEGRAKDSAQQIGQQWDMKQGKYTTGTQVNSTRSEALSGAGAMTTTISDQTQKQTEDVKLNASEQLF